MEEAIQNPSSRKLISRFYRALSSPDNVCTAHVRALWETDFGEVISDDEWDGVGSTSAGCLFANKARELQFKVIHRLQIAPVKHNKFNPLFSKYCYKCKIIEGSYFHCIFECPLINGFWIKVCKEIDIIFKRKLALEPISCILGVQRAALNLSPPSMKLLKVLLFNARRCILLQWISDSVPTISHWTRSIMELLPLEAIRFWLNDKPFRFFQIWDPFLEYVGDDGAQALLWPGMD